MLDKSIRAAKLINLIQMQPPPDQKSIAAALGLSQATVSRALRNDGRIARKTRDRVWQEAERQGYRPAPLIAARSSREHSRAGHLRDAPIAVLRHTEDERNRPSGSLIQLFMEPALQRGFLIRDFDVRKEGSVPALRQRLFAQGFQGILIQYHRGSPEWFHEFDFRSFAVVSICSDFENEPIMTIRPRQHRMVRQLYGKLRERGCRRIGAVLWDPSHHADDVARMAGFAAAQLEEPGGRFQPESLYLVKPNDPDAGLGFRKWMKTYQPDGLILISLREWGWMKRLPRTLQPKHPAVLLRPETAPAGIPGFTRNSKMLGQMAVDWLEQSIRIRRTGFLEAPLLLSVPPVWCD